jgi:thioredoxin:protein disulfide reductase
VPIVYWLLEFLNNLPGYTLIALLGTGYLASMTMKHLLFTAGLLALCARACAEDFLPAEEAFVFSSNVSGKSLTWHWQLALGYSLYRDRIHVRIVEPASVHLGDLKFPKPIIHQDKFFGPQAIYLNELTLSAPVHCRLSVPTPVTIEIRYQGCADAGLCYPPETRKVPLTLPVAACGA